MAKSATNIKKKKTRVASVTLSKHHTSIETLTIAAWWKIEETNDLGHLYLYPRKMKAAEVPKLLRVWERIMDEFIDEFGISPDYKAILTLRLQIRLCEIEFAETGDRIHLTEKNIYEKQLAELTGDKKKTSNDEAIIHASKFMGFNLNENQTSVKRFYTIRKAMEKTSR